MAYALTRPRRLSARVVGPLDRMTARFRPMRKGLTEHELEVIRTGQALVSFSLLAPTLVPAGYVLASVDPVPGSRDVMTFVYRASRRRSFRFTLRTHMLDLKTELRLSHVPSQTIRAWGREWLVISGGFVGEPVDLWHWHTSRRGIAWEQEGLICEITQVIASSPSLWVSMRVAAGVAPVNISGVVSDEGRRRVDVPKHQREELTSDGGIG